MKVIKDIVYDEFNNKLDLYLPENTNFKTVIYFHGGGLVSGEKDYDNMVSFGKTYTDNGYAFVSANYRMYPVNKFPTFIIDASSAVKYIYDNIGNYNGSKDLIVTGSSAGAWLALMLCFNKEYLLNKGIDPLTIKSWIIDSAEPLSHFNVLENELGIDPRLQRIDEYAPIYYLNKDSEFSSILLLYYEHDMICRNEQNRLFYAVIKMFNENSVIKQVELKGNHCDGSSKVDDNGEYPYIVESLKWLKERGL